jgi:hypothetical protein
MAPPIIAKVAMLNRHLLRRPKSTSAPHIRLHSTA